MSRINEKLGLRSAGKRAMMQLPKNREEAAALTALTCPVCGRRGQRVVTKQSAGRLCPHCGFIWAVEAR